MQEIVPIDDNYLGIPFSLQSAQFGPEELQDEAFLNENIGDLWKIRQCYDTDIKGSRTNVRIVDKNLGQLLFNMKRLLVKPGRNGQWSAWLKKAAVPRATADRLVKRFAARLPPGEQLPHEAISSEPTREDVGKVFGHLWPRLQKTLTTNEFVFQFIGYVATASAIPHERREEALVIFNPERAASPAPEVAVQPDDLRSSFDPEGDVL